MKITAILFDKDGTLLDFHKTWMPVYGAVARLFAEDDEAAAERLLVAAGLDAARGVIKSGSLLAAGNNEEIADCFAEALGKSARDVGLRRGANVGRNCRHEANTCRT